MLKKKINTKIKWSDASVINTLKNAAKKLKGPSRRSFMAQATRDHFAGNARNAERVLGWGRETIKKGLCESEGGFIFLDDYSSRGNKKSEEKDPKLKENIRSIVEQKIQANPSIEIVLIYKKITAKVVAKALQKDYGYRVEDLPCNNTIRNILNRMGYGWKRVRKKRVQKDQ
jgi:hypothetical protein